MNVATRGIVAAALALTLGLLAACSSDSPPSPTPTEEPEPFTLETYPEVDGSTATHPLSLAFKEAFTGADLTPDDLPISKTHGAYLKLIAGEVDLILVTSPSEDELAAAAAAGVELEVIPVVREGFVFITNATNPVTSLTVAQLRDIYAGKITNWSQVGGPDSPITAYQRPENSGSQTGILDLVMQGTPMAPAPTAEYVISDMEGTVDAVASYDNSSGALGYSYYYFVTAMYGELARGNAKDGVRLMAVNGVTPTDETIRSGEYPLTSAYYIVVLKSSPADSPARRLAAMMLSERGQRVAQRAGYVPVMHLPPLPAPTYTPPPAGGPYSLSSLSDTYELHLLTVTVSEERVGASTVWRLTIDGLVDQSVEDSINARFRQLQDDAIAAYRSPYYSADATLWWNSVDARGEEPVRFYVGGNVVSLWTSYEGGSDALNIRLDTGEEFELADVFLDGTDLEAVLAGAYRGTLIRQHFGDPEDVEARVLDMLSDYRRGAEVDFYLWSLSDVTVAVGSHYIGIPLEDYWQSLAIFRRFATSESIYTSTDTRTCPVFTVAVAGAPEIGCSR